MNTKTRGDILAERIENLIKKCHESPSFAEEITDALAEYRAPAAEEWAAEKKAFAEGKTVERDELREEIVSEKKHHEISLMRWCNDKDRANKAERERDELETLKADKARLDWLLARGLCFRGADKFDENWRVGNETEWLYADQYARDAIDAAMKGAE